MLDEDDDSDVMMILMTIMQVDDARDDENLC